MASLSPALQAKYAALQEGLVRLGSVAVAYSGGVDSSLLLKAAKDCLGPNCLALTACLRSFPRRELEAAQAFCRQLGVEHSLCPLDELALPGFAANPPDRCYLCKKAVFASLWAAARGAGYQHLAEGSNLDDAGDYRPGLRALAEAQVLSPLRQAGLHKEEVRSLSAYLGLPTAAKPSLACLASRIPYGEAVTAAKLAQIDQAEEFLLGLGFSQVRVRCHGRLARIELPPEELGQALRQARLIYQRLRQTGFTYVSLDLLGYRSGSLNEGLPRPL